MKISITEYVAGVTEPYRWERKVESEVRDTEYQLRMTQLEIERMQRLIAGFELRELGTETRAGAKERAAKEARTADRDAKRAVKAEKARILAEKNAARAAKAAELQARYLGELEALAEKAEATDELKSAATQRAARALVECWAKEARRTPKVTYHTHELGQDELFIRLGLAERETRTYGDYIRHEYYTIG